MWKFNRKPKTPPTPDEKKVRNFGIWHFVLIAFIVIWMIGAYIYLEKRTQLAANVPSVIVLDETGNINLMNDMFTTGTNKQLFPPKSEPVDTPKFEIRDKYNYGDVVVVKYFYVEAVIIDKSVSVGDNYTILYKDHNHVLQTISLPRTMLMAPAAGVLNPVSMLVD